MNKLYRVRMRKTYGDAWKLWTNYPTPDDAELAAKGLLTSDVAVESEVIEVGLKSERRILHCRRDINGNVQVERKAGNQ